MNWSLMAFGAVAALAVGGMDYVQQSRQAGLDIGALGFGRYSDTVKDRIIPSGDNANGVASQPVDTSDPARAGDKLKTPEIITTVLGYMKKPGKVPAQPPAESVKSSEAHATEPTIRKAAGEARVAGPQQGSGFGVGNLVYKNAKTRGSKKLGAKRVMAPASGNTGFLKVAGTEGAGVCQTVGGTKRCGIPTR